MANTKTSILDALVAQINAMPEVSKATRVLLTPADTRKNAPYVGVLSGPEETVVEDATHVRYELEINLITVYNDRDIEKFIDALKNKLYTASLATTIGAKQVHIIGQDPVNLIDADKYSSVRIMVVITYVATKAGF